MQARKKNMQRMAEVVPESDEQVLQHFLSNSTWDARGVMDQVAGEADEWLGGAQSALLIDESAMVKKGTESVGVARQWCGRLGKVDNCQVAVFGALSHERDVTLVDGRLYLPREWSEDRKRCEAAGIPRAARGHKTKPELALEIVRHARAQGLRFGWVGADGLYGNDPALLRTLEQAGETFLMDVHKDQWIYPEDPCLRIPAPENERGRRPSRPVAQSAPQRVDHWAEQQPRAAWRAVNLRGSTQGRLRVEILHRRVWVWDGRETQAHCWHLIVRREGSGKTVQCKYSLSNAPAQTSGLKLAKMQGQRYWVERAFQDAKSQSGLAHYQARGWNAWHHHVALVMMAMVFMLKERIGDRDAYPLLTCADIEVLLAHFLPRRDVNNDEVIRQMNERHRQRQAAIDAATRAQRKHARKTNT